MFGIGMSELLVILVVALLFLGPEKLPDAAKKLSRGLREFRQHGRELQRTLQDDSELGAAVRDLKSALRGDDFHPVPYRREGDGSDADPKGRDQPAQPDPYGLAEGPATAGEEGPNGDRELAGAAEPDTTTPEPGAPPPAGVPVEVESSRRGGATSDPDGRKRS